MIIDNVVTLEKIFSSFFTSPGVELLLSILLPLTVGVGWFTSFVFVKKRKGNTPWSTMEDWYFFLIFSWILLAGFWGGFGSFLTSTYILSTSAEKLNDFYGFEAQASDSSLSTFTVDLEEVRVVLDNPGEITLMETVNDFTVDEGKGKLVKTESSLYGLFDEETKKFVLYASAPGSEEMTELEPVR